MSVLSIDIGSRTIKLAEGTYNKGNLMIAKTAEIPTPEYAIEGDRIINVDALATSIENLIKSEGFNAKENILTINATGAMIRDIDLPKATRKELDNMIKTELIQTHHIDEADVIQYKPVHSFQNENGAAMTKYRAVALDDELVDNYHELAKKLKFKNVSLDINMNCMDKLVSLVTGINNQPIAGKACAFIDMGAQHTTIYIEANGTQELFRHLSIGSGQIERIISDEALSPPLEIRKLKEEGYDFFSDQSEGKNYFTILKPFFYSLQDEVGKSIRFYNNRSEGSAVEQVYIFGGGSRLKGLPEYLEGSIGLPVNRIEDVNNISGSYSNEEIPTHLNAFGALIKY